MSVSRKCWLFCQNQPMVSSPFDLAMREALLLAEHASGQGDIPVGAIVLDEAGQIIGRGHNTREQDHDPLGHAEIVALRDAAAHLGNWRLDECTLVVTLEPCTMCAGAIVQSRIAHLVFGAFDSKAGAVGSLWDVVRDRRLPHRAQVTSGVLENDCAHMLSEFFQAQR
jgi:tRNA(adenine34) deaminase